MRPIVGEATLTSRVPCFARRAAGAEAAVSNREGWWATPIGVTPQPTTFERRSISYDKMPVKVALVRREQCRQTNSGGSTREGIDMRSRLLARTAALVLALGGLLVIPTSPASADCSHPNHPNEYTGGG